MLKEAHELQQKAKSQGDLEKAMQKYEQALSAFSKIGKKTGEAVCPNNIGLVYKSWGQYAKALEYYEKSLEITRKIGDTKQEGVTLNNIGGVYHHRGQYAKALEYYEKALEIMKKIGDVKGQGYTLNGIGWVYESWGQYAKALEYYEKALAIHKKVGTAKEEGKVGGLSFARLPLTGDLANDLNASFKGSCTVFTGLKASKETFLKDVAPRLDDYSKVVFATHGYFGKGLPGINEPVVCC
jgi:tetratricopeptide (TPR) repeat protein